MKPIGKRIWGVTMSKLTEKHESQVQKLELLFQQKSEAKENLHNTLENISNIKSTLKEYEEDRVILTERIQKLDKLIGEVLDGKYESGYN